MAITWRAYCHELFLRFFGGFLFSRFYVDSISEVLACFKHRESGCGNLNLFAVLRVRSFTGSALTGSKSAKADQLYFITAFLTIKSSSVSMQFGKDLSFVLTSGP